MLKSLHDECGLMVEWYMWVKCGITCLSKAPRLPKEHCFFRRFLGFVHFPSGQSKVWMTMSGALVEWIWQGKTEILWEKPVALPLCPPKTAHGLTWYWPTDCASTDRRLTAWTIAWRPYTTFSLYLAVNTQFRRDKYEFFIPMTLRNEQKYCVGEMRSLLLSLKHGTSRLTNRTRSEHLVESRT